MPKPRTGTNSHKANASEERIAAAAVLSWNGSTHADIAKEMGVGRETVSRWAATPAWKAAQKELSAAVRETAVAQLEGMADLAVSSLRKILERGGEKDADTIRAAVAVLDRLGVGPHSTQHVDVTEDVTPEEVDAEVAKLRRELGLDLEGENK